MSGISETVSLQAEREERLDQLIAGYLAAVAAGSPPDRQRLLADNPDLAGDLKEFFADQDRFRAAAAPLRAAVGPSRAPLPTQVGPYEILGEIARGGMGVVLRARHRTLGRVVALKLLAAGHFAEPAEVQRFRREVEAVARLDHPNVVPVYEVGDHAGLPYFTMKLLPGTLAQTLRTGPLPPRAAAALVAPVARAVHHAHQRGILHRDLKPANVLLDVGQASQPVSSLRPGTSVTNGSSDTPFLRPGQDVRLDSLTPVPLIADFGLARPADASALTSTGAIVGTPAYVAPEQARGSHDEVTVASDVYGLGAILYESLTGRPPFKGATPIETLRLVIDTDPTPPRSLCPQIDADLETICLKCLRKKPSERYASAADLADDLDRYLRREPIRARPIGPLTRLGRQMRRQPAITALVASLLLVAAAGFVLVLSQWRRAEAALALEKHQRDQVQFALTEAETARSEAEGHLAFARRQAEQAEASRKLAETNFRQAHAAVNEFCVSVSDELRDRPGLQELHKKLVQSARLYYQTFLADRAGDAALRRELADTHVRVAEIISRVGERREALTAYREALAIYRELHVENPDDPVVQRKLAGTLSNVAIKQDLGEGLETSAEAVAAYRKFSAARPDDLDLASGLALAVANRGSKFIAAGRFNDAASCLVEAAELQQHLATTYPWNDPLWSELASTLDNYGVLLSRLDRRAESLCSHLQALELREMLLARRPDDVPRQSNVAAAWHHVGVALRDAGQKEAAAAAFEQSLAERRRIAESNASVIRYQVDLAVSLSNSGIAYSRQGQRDKAIACYHHARQILERQLETDPGSVGLRKLQAEMWFNVGVTYGAMKRRKEEGEALVRARAIQEDLVRGSPADVEHRVALGRTLNNLGINLWVRVKEDESKEVLRQAIASTGKLVEKAPHVVGYRRLLNAHHGVLAEIEWRQGHAKESAEQVRVRIALWQDEPKEFFNAGCEFARLLDLDSVTPEQRRRWSAEALAALRKALELGHADVKAWREHSDLGPLRKTPEFERLLREVEGRVSR